MNTDDVRWEFDQVVGFKRWNLARFRLVQIVFRICSGMCRAAWALLRLPFDVF